MFPAHTCRVAPDQAMIDAWWQDPRASSPFRSAQVLFTLAFLSGALFHLIIPGDGDYLWQIVLYAIVAAIVSWQLSSRLSPATYHRVNYLGMLVGAALASLHSPLRWNLAAVLSIGFIGGLRRRHSRVQTLVAGVLATITLTLTARLHEIDHAWVVTSAILGVTLILVSDVDWSLVNRRRESETLADMSSFSGSFVWEGDLESGNLVGVTGDVLGVMGYSAQEFASSDVYRRMHPDDAFQWVDENRSDLENSVFTRTIRLRHRAGHWVTLAEEIKVRNNPDGTRVLRGVSSDITRVLAAEQSRERYRGVVSRMRASVVMCHHDDQGTVVVDEINATAAERFNINLIDAAGQPLVETVPWCGDPVIQAALHRMTEDEPDKLLLTRFSPNGVTPVDDAEHEDQAGASPTVLDIEVVPLNEGLFAVVMHDISEVVAGEETIRHQANHDGLTGLPNRFRFMARAVRALDERGKDERVGLLMVDFDRFKEINDTLGHTVGDDLLRTISQRLAARFDRKDVTVARIGGDEFALLITGNPSLDELTWFADETCDTVSLPSTVAGMGLRITASVGIASAPRDGVDVTTLFRHADMAMYQAKNLGSRWAVYDGDDSEHSMQRLMLASQLHQALESDQFELWFQPQCDLNTGRLVGFEGLARWRHPTLGVLSPESFLDVVEVSDQREVFDRQVIRMGAAFAQQCRAVGLSVRVGVNVGATSLIGSHAADQVATELQAGTIEPGDLVIEITEDALTGDTSMVADQVRELSALGVDMSIDDFGTGHSSLGRLRTLAMSELKIDRTFVEQLALDDVFIVRTIVHLAIDLGLRCIAEGIDDAATVERLLSFGCTLGQGYGIARPMPKDEALELVRTLAGYGEPVLQLPV